ncbi:MAG: PQQ-binding-like beta-propeller repeat protein, partial [Phycisphaerae bacterium]
GAILGSLGFMLAMFYIWFALPAGDPVREHWRLLGLTIWLALMGVVIWGTLVGSLMPFDAVVINTLTTAYVFDRRSQGDANMYRKIDLKFAASTGAAVNDDSIFIGSTEGRCESVLLAPAVHRWDLQTEGRIEADPDTFDRLVYVASTASSGNRFHAVRSREEYERVWSQKLDGPVVANFHVDQRGCFVPCKNNVLYAFSPASGEPLWAPVSTDGRLTQDVQVSDRTVFQYADADKFYAVNLLDGSIRWTMPEGRVVLAAMKGNVYVLDDQKNLRIIDEILGQEKAALPMYGFDFLLPNTQAKAIYGATADGKLYCINPAEDEVLPRGGGGF